jgi:hypothetical protein
MRKTKTIKQYSDKGFYIGISIKADGNIKEASNVHFYGKIRCTHDKIYNDINKNKKREYNKQYHIIHRNLMCECSMQFRIKNPDYNKQYKKIHPENVKKYKHNMRAKYRGWLSPKPINSYFTGAHLHHLHIDDDHRIAIYIPAELHNSIYHAYNKPETMNKINELAMEWYYDRNSRNY